MRGRYPMALLRAGALCLAMTMVTSPALARDLTPSGEEMDAYLRSHDPDFQDLMTSRHILGELGVSSVDGQESLGGELAGWSHWDRRFLLDVHLGGAWLSRRYLGLPTISGSSDSRPYPLVGSLASVIAGYNVIGVQSSAPGLQPLIDLGGRTVVSLGWGLNAGLALAPDAKLGLNLASGPALGLRHRLLDWHNMTLYGRGFLGLNRQADVYETGLHLNFGDCVFELGFRGGRQGLNLASQDGKLGVSTAGQFMPHETWFLRLGLGT